MQVVTLGKTGMQVSVAGLGCGGFSRLGMFSKGLTHASGIVRHAFDNGVTFFDTAYAYGTHPAVAQGLQGIPRDQYVLSSKFPPEEESGDLRKAGALEVILDDSLRALRTDHVDIWHLHGVGATRYTDVRDRFVPELIRMREKGKIRFIGITEAFATDTRHEMLKMAVNDAVWDVMMVGQNMLNPSAAHTILPETKRLGIGTLCMFAVRSALSNPEKLDKEVLRMIEAGQLDVLEAEQKGILDFLVRDGHAGTIMEAAYRFCRHTEGLDVILTGTGSQDHLTENLRSLMMPTLSGEVLGRLSRLFGRVNCVSGQ